MKFRITILHSFFSIISIIFIVVTALFALKTDFVVMDQVSYVDDLWFLFDSMTRAAAGEIAHIDFYSPIGQAFYWPYWLASQLVAPSTKLLNLANFIAAVVSFALCLLMLWGRVSTLTLWLVALLVFTTAISTRNMETFIYNLGLSYLAPYNRWGWALLAPVAVFALAPRGPAPTAGAFTAGIALMLMFYMKLSYFIVGLGFVVNGLIFSTISPLTFLFLLVGFLSTTIGVEILFGNTLAYFRDIGMAISANTGVLRLNKVVITGPEMVAYGFMVILILWLCRSGQQAFWSWLRQCIRPLILTGVVLLGGWAVLLQNHPRSGSLLCVIALVLAYEWAWASGLLRRGDAEPSQADLKDDPVAATSGYLKGFAKTVISNLGARIKQSPVKNLLELVQLAITPKNDAKRLENGSVWEHNHFAALGVMALSVFFFALTDMIAVQKQFKSGRLLRKTPIEAFVHTPLSGLRLPLVSGARRKGYRRPVTKGDLENLYDCSNENCLEIQIVIDGLDLIRNAKPKGPVLALYFGNVFPTLTDSSSPSGAAIWWHYGRSYSESSHPDAQKMFEGLGAVLVPIREQSVTRFLFKIYEDELRDRFLPGSTGEHWQIWLPRTPVGFDNDR